MIVPAGCRLCTPADAAPRRIRAPCDAMGLSLVTLRVDKLSLLFGYVFLLAALLGGIYALHVRDTVQHAAGLIYAGCALGAIFAGDLVTLFIFWEGIAVASVFLIWASRNEQRLSRRHALSDHSDRFWRVAACRRADPLSADRFDRIRRDRACFAGRGADLARLRHKVRVSAVAHLAAGRLSGSDGIGDGAAVILYDQGRGLCLGARLSPAPRFWCRSALR